MDIGAIGASTSRLLEAFQRVGLSEGAGLRSPEGPSGQPDAKLVQEFLQALEGPGNADPAGHDPVSAGGAPTGLDGSGHVTRLPGEAGDMATGTFGVDNVLQAPGDVQEVRVASVADDTGAMTQNTVARADAASSSIPAGDEASLGVADADAPQSSTRVASSGYGDVVQEDTAPTRVAPSDEARAGESPLPDEMLREVAQLLERVSGGNPSPSELYRLQYMVSMLNVQASQGSKISQQGAQGFESLLKQQG